MSIILYKEKEGLKRKQLKGEYKIDNDDGVSRHSFYQSYSFGFCKTIFYFFSCFPGFFSLIFDELTFVCSSNLGVSQDSGFSLLSQYILLDHLCSDKNNTFFNDDYQVDISPLHWGPGGKESLMIRCWIIHFLCFSRVVRVRLKSSSWRLLSWIPPKETVTCIMVSGREFFPCPPHFLLMLVWDLGFASKEHFGRTLTLFLQS